MPPSPLPPQQEKDVQMAPPISPFPSSNGASRSADVQEKYSRLKKKYFLLEQKQKETTIELARSAERNVQIRQERNALLDRIIELEAQQSGSPGAMPHPGGDISQQFISGAFPRSLVSQRAQASFVSNLRRADLELEHEDQEADPVLTSQHVGPAARKRQAAEDKERHEEEMRESKRVARKPKTSTRNPGKDVNSILTLAPPLPAGSAPGEGHSPPLLVTSNGTRLRIRPPRPQPDHSLTPSGPGVPPPQAHSPHSATPRARSTSPRSRSQSPISPLPSPGDSQSAFNLMGPSRTTPTNHIASQNSRPSELQRQTKPKRLKAHTVTSKSYSIPMVPRDKITGKPMLPLNVGIMTVVSLGEVCMREHFHTERYIFPVGYEVTRRYLSTLDPNAEVVYHCTILDGGDGPKFQIIASDIPEKPIIAGTATGAWSGIVRAANSIRNRQHSNSVSGPDYFGLGQNTIKHLIQELPGAHQLRDYVWQNFVEGG